MIVASALLSLLFVPMIFDRMFVYPASSATERRAEPAFKPVPGAAGMSLIIADLYLYDTGYGTDPDSVIGVTLMFLYAS